jgi:4-amino-4-deoxy-L-arabinose transferase-like glycosyltransferase
MPDKRNGLLVYAVLLTTAFSFRVAVARLVFNDESIDSDLYVQLARNLLEQGLYSHASVPPFVPSLIRFPGYPIFLAGVYSLFGTGNEAAVQVVQALIDTSSCALIAFIAFLWEPQEKLKRRTSLTALVLAAYCPFTAIYVGTILPETLTVFFAVAMTATATLALKAATPKRVLSYWLLTGALGGLAVLCRPDSALFALAIGITIMVATLARGSGVEFSKKRDEILYRSSRAAYLVAVFALAFIILLVPWTLRNYRVFHVFQPLTPAHAEAPGEFAARGYRSWLRTWLDDGRYVGPLVWSLDESPINLESIPQRAFDSAEERSRVGALLEKYNHPTRRPQSGDDLFVDSPLEDETNPAEPDEGAKDAGETTAGNEELSDTDATASDELEKSEDGRTAGNEQRPVRMTPKIDGGFAQLASERIARNPIRYYLGLPVRRAVWLWFDTHSQYFPFEGELLPLRALDYEANQQFWLPLLALLTSIYTLLGIAGGWLLWRTRSYVSCQCLLLAVLMMILRLGYFSTLETPESRYVMQLFPFLSILGALALTRILAQISDRTFFSSARK